MPSPTMAGVLGITRTQRAPWGAIAARASTVQPAAMEMSSFCALNFPSASITVGTTWGFTAITMASQASTTCSYVPATPVPNSACRVCTFSVSTSYTNSVPAAYPPCTMLRIIAWAMFPAPINPMRIRLILHPFLIIYSPIIITISSRHASYIRRAPKLVVDLRSTVLYNIIRSVEGE